MLNENAEARIRKYLEVTISDGNMWLDYFIKSGELKHLDLALMSESHAACYWNIYHSTITQDTFDNSLWNSLCEFRTKLQENTPHGA